MTKEAEKILEKYWGRYTAAMGLPPHPMGARAVEYIVMAMEEYRQLKADDAE